MKMPESIIEKYQLTPAENHIGEAVIHNLLCFKSSLPGFKGIIFMECGFDGKPCKDITFYNKSAKSGGTFTPEFMNDSPIDVILNVFR